MIRPSCPVSLLTGRPPGPTGCMNRVIARKAGAQVRLWARTTSDYSKAFTRIRDAVAALPVNGAVLRWRGGYSAGRQLIRFRGAEIAQGPSRSHSGGL